MHRAPSRSRRAVLAVLAALALVAGALSFAVTPTSAPVADPAPLSVAQECQAALGYPARSQADKDWLNRCVHALRTPGPGPSGSPSTTPTVGPTATPTPSPTTPAPTTPGPTMTPSPTPTTPAPAGWPTPETTGWRHTGVALTVVTATLYTSTAGQVIDSVEARGGIVVRHNNVTVRRSWVQGAGSGQGAGIWIVAGVSGTVVEDVEVSSRPGADPTVESQLVDRAITGKNTTGTVYRRVYAHRIIRGLEPGCDTLIEDSYVDDEVNPEGNHMSAIGASSCAEFALAVRHNHIGLTPNPMDSAALLLYPPQVGAYGTQHVAVSWVDNEIRGGTYCLWLSSDPQFVGTVVVSGNRFRTDYYAGCGLYGATFTDHMFTNPPEGNVATTWADNRWMDGRPVTP